MFLFKYKQRDESSTAYYSLKYTCFIPNECLSKNDQCCASYFQTV